MATHASSYGFFSLSPPYITTYQFHVTKDKHWHRRGEITTESTMGRNGIKFNVFKPWTYIPLYLCAQEHVSGQASERMSVVEHVSKASSAAQANDLVV